MALVATLEPLTYNAHEAPAPGVGGGPAVVRRPRRDTAAPWSAVAVGVVVLVYVWIVTAGHWTWWPTYTAYYAKLAEAFRHGQTALLEQPDPRLLALSDPYDAGANEPYRLHDVSLYRGRYYLYWGPVPAILLLAAGPVLRAHVIPDQALVLVFAGASIALVALILLRLRGRFFPDVPAWTVPLAVLAIGLSAPLAFVLGRAAVYEAAITSMQMFVLAGFYCALRGLDRPRPSPGWLLLAGASFAGALGSRVSCAPAVAGAAAVVAWRLWQAGRGAPLRAMAGALLTFALPPVAAGSALAAYNYARFGSVTEVGVRYQLTSFNINANFDAVTSAGHVLPNLYSYLWRPPVRTGLFPFLLPRSGLELGALPEFIPLPAFRLAGEATAGLLVATPVAWFMLVPLAAAVAGGVARRRARAARSLPPSTPKDPPPRANLGLGWVVALLTVVAALGSVPALVLCLASVRYQLDWTAPLLLLSVIGVWMGDQRLARWRPLRMAWLTVAGALAAWTALVGTLLAVSSTDSHFLRNNPVLFQQLMESTYVGPVPAVAQVTATFGADETPDGTGWWIGQHMLRVDVMTDGEGWVRLGLAAALGPCLDGSDSARLTFAGQPRQPGALPEVLGTVTISRRAGVPAGGVAAGVPFRVALPVRHGFNRFFLFTPDEPTCPVRHDRHDGDCRWLISVNKLAVRPRGRLRRRCPPGRRSRAF